MNPLFATSPFETFEPPAEAGVFTWQVQFPSALFMQQMYFVTVSLYRPWQVLEVLQAVLGFSVVGSVEAAEKLPGGKAGAVHVACEWIPVEAPQ
jgi:hypothetical protein